MLRQNMRLGQSQARPVSFGDAGAEAATMTKRWLRRPDGSNWGDFGDDDQLGRLNFITPAKVLEGMREVREGHRFCLSLPLDFPGGNRLNARRFPPVLEPTMAGSEPAFCYPYNKAKPGATDVVCDDAVKIWLQYSTQWDSFAHMGSQFDADGDGIAEYVFYNGYRAGEHVVGPVDYRTGKATDAGRPMGALKLGMEHMAESCVQGRAVLIDLHRHFGRERRMVGWRDLAEIMRKDRVEVEKGDMVLLHTGWAQAVLEEERNPTQETLHDSCTALDGRDAGIQRWIVESGLSVLVADNYAVEAHPSRPCDRDPCAMLPIHELCLFKLGIHLGEIWHLTPLAQWLAGKGRSRFLLTAPPLRLPGAVGSPATPVATV